MLYSQKRTSSVVHFKMAGSCSDIYVSQLQGCVFPADVYPYMYIAVDRIEWRQSMIDIATAISLTRASVYIKLKHLIL